jgi:hypothetical protein
MNLVGGNSVEVRERPATLERVWPRGTLVRIADPSDRLCDGMTGTVISTKYVITGGTRHPFVYVHLGSDSGPDGWAFSPANLERIG